MKWPEKGKSVDSQEKRKNKRENKEKEKMAKSKYEYVREYEQSDLMMKGTYGSIISLK